MRILLYLLLALALLRLVVVVARQRFRRTTDEQVRAFLELPAVEEGPAQIREKELAGLPPPVARWLRASGAAGRPIPRYVRLRQRGSMATAPGSKPLAARAEQYFRTDLPGFVWHVDVRAGGILPLFSGRDTFRDGRGRMRIELAALLPVVDQADERIDQGAMLRFLAEIVWFPGAALRPWIRWDPIDDRSARATMEWGGRSCSALFRFDEADRVVGLEAERYMGGGEAARLHRWIVRATAWRSPGGVEIPVAGEVVWDLPEGEFVFYRWEVPELDYDLPALYRR